MLTQQWTVPSGADVRRRIWKDLNFHRPTETTRYRHIDALFGEPGRNVIDWNLIEPTSKT